MTLTRELANKSSPLRMTLEAMLPDLGRHARIAWKAQMAGAVARFNPDLPPSALGHAINESIAWQFAGIDGQLPGAALLIMMGAHPDVMADLTAEMQTPCPGVDPDREARIACLAGLVDQTYRTRRAEDPWYEPLLTRHTLDETLAAVDPPWVDDIVATTTAALTALAPVALHNGVVRAPTFGGSGAVGGADADLILGSSLIEMKAVRNDALVKGDIQQVVTYSLLDWDDQYGLDEVAILSARHGALVQWPLEELVFAGSRGLYDLAEARGRLKDSLTQREAS